MWSKNMIPFNKYKNYNNIWNQIIHYNKSFIKTWIFFDSETEINSANEKLIKLYISKIIVIC